MHFALFGQKELIFLMPQQIYNNCFLQSKALLFSFFFLVVVVVVVILIFSTFEIENNRTNGPVNYVGGFGMSLIVKLSAAHAAVVNTQYLRR